MSPVEKQRLSGPGPEGRPGLPALVGQGGTRRRWLAEVPQAQETYGPGTGEDGPAQEQDQLETPKE